MPALPELTGKTLGEFTVLRRLGQGGMGQVYLAEQLSLKRKVALKVLRADLAANQNALKRFRAEAEAVARATHANIVQVYAIGADIGLHYMALEFVDGMNLRDYLAKKGTPDLPVALSIIRQVSSALARAHELGIVHRDIKPENILLTRNREVKVTDFGLSRCFAGEQQSLSLTASGVTMGTPLYMSPEQVQGKTVDPRSDIYSFGVTAYHMLTGDPPFRGETAFEVAVQHVQNDPPPLQSVRPDLPAELCELIEKMMAKKPAQRFQTARDILRELSQFKERLSSTRPMPPVTDESFEFSPAESAAAMAPTQILDSKRRGNWKLWAVPLTLILALLAGAGLAFKFTKAPVDPLIAQIDPKSPRDAFLAEEEQRLRREIELYAAGNNRRHLREGMQASIDLALLYIQQDRWRDAEGFFKDLSTDPKFGRQYQELGQLGLGVTFAFQDNLKESLAMFEQARAGLEREPNKRFVFLNHPGLRLVVAKALERDRINCQAQQVPFPPELDAMRRPNPFGKRPRPKQP